MQIRTLLGVGVFLLSQGAAGALPVRVPKSWWAHHRPEHENVFEEGMGPLQDPEKEREKQEKKDEDALSGSLQKIYQANYDSLPVLQKEEAPTDWVPWHLLMLTTELGMTTQGLFGVLTIQGTPSVQLYWTREVDLQSQSSEVPDSERNQPILGNVKPQASKAEVTRDLEPMIQAVMATGKVNDGKAFKDHLSRTYNELQSLVSVLESQTSSSWAT